MPIIETENLWRSFGTVVAVKALALSIDAGEVFGLLGPNGAGKTTTIKILTTLLAPTSGRARVAGYDVVHHAGDVRRAIGYVPQLLSSDGALTGYENLLMFAKLYDVPRAARSQRIDNAMDLMGLGEAAGKLVRTYSGGMIRRLEIAQAMLHQPRILFLDEPTVGLDPSARRAVWDYISQLRAEQTVTILLTTHLMEEADTLCSRVAFMHLGQIVADGAPTALKASLKQAGATLDDVFLHYVGAGAQGGTYHEISRTRRTARRLG